MGTRQVAIHHLVLAESGLPGDVERLRRPSFLRPRLVGLILPVDVEIRCEPQLRIFVRPDLRPGLREALIAAGVVPVPVSIEQDLYMAHPGVLRHELEQFVRPLGGPGIDHQRAAVGVDQKHRIGAHSCDQDDVIREDSSPQRGLRRTCRCAPGRQQRERQPGGGALQELSTVRSGTHSFYTSSKVP